MRNARLFRKRILALALSVSMVFASTNTYVVLAADSETQGKLEDTDVSDGTDLSEVVGKSNVSVDVTGNEAADVTEDNAESVDKAVDEAEDVTEEDAEPVDEVVDEEADVAEEDAESVDEAVDEAVDVTEEDAELIDEAGDDASDLTEENTEDVDDTEDTVSDTTDEEDMEALYEDATLYLADAAGFTVDVNGKLTAYTGAGGDITIPDTVITIGSKVFSGNKDITSVTFSSSVRTIEGSAFSGCTSLGEVQLNEGLLTIEGLAFDGAALGTKHTAGGFDYGTLTIPSTVKTIGNGAFRGCSYLGEIIFADGENTELEIGSSDYYKTFAGCDELTKVIFPSRLETIPTYAFYECAKLEELAFNENLKIIGSSAFRGCTGLQKVEFPSTLETIKESAFAGCTSLGEIKLNEGLVTIEGLAFDGAPLGKKLSTGEFEYGVLTIPSTVEYLGHAAFRGCSYLMEIIFENGKNTKLEIGSSDYYKTFSGCKVLTKVTFPSRLETIPTYAFYECAKLEELAFNENLKTIGSSAFRGCTGLQKVEFPSTLETIKESAFAGCTSLGEVKLNEGLVTIEGLAFDGVPLGKKLSTGEFEYGVLTIPTTVEYIGHAAFRGCSYLGEIAFENGENTKLEIGSSDYYKTFSGCTALTKVTFPSRLEAIPDYAFYECTKLEKLVFNKNLKTISGSAFRGCKSLEDVDIPAAVETIGDSAFAGCSSLRRVNLKEGLKTIGGSAFNGVPFGGELSSGSEIEYSSLTIPSTVESIGAQAFSGCIYLEEIIFENGETVVLDISASSYYRQFNTCSSLKNVMLPNRLEQLKTNTFVNCGKLEALYIPKTVTTIEKNAINNCPYVTIYGEYGSQAEIYAKDNNITFKSIQELETTVTGVSLSISEITRGGQDAIGEKIRLTAKVEPFSASNRTVSYESTNTAVATVDKDGLVTLTGYGEADIIVTTADGGKTAKCHVTVLEQDDSQSDNKPSDDQDDNKPSDDQDDTSSDDVGDNPYYVDPGEDTDYEKLERTDLEEVGYQIAKISDKTYNGIRQEPKVTIKNANGKKVTLTEGTDYRILYSNNLNKGTATVTVKGNGKYRGELTRDFEIKAKSIKKLKVVVGSMVEGDTEFPIYVYDGATRVKLDKDYTAAVTANVSNGVKVTLTGMDNYKDSVTTKITVYKKGTKTITPGDVTISGSNGGVYKASYTGKAIKVAKLTKLAVRVNGEDLTEGRHYTLSYKNNTNVGTAYVIVKGKGGYKGTVVVPFKITANTGTLMLKKDIASKTYNGKLQKPSFTVQSVSGTVKKTLKKNKDYTVYYKNNLHRGEATVVVTGIGNYAGQNGRFYFTINPQKISKATVAGNRTDGLKVTYAKRQLKEGVDYYTPEYDESSKTATKIKVTIRAVEGPGRDFEGSVIKNVKLK